MRTRYNNNNNNNSNIVQGLYECCRRYCQFVKFRVDIIIVVCIDLWSDVDQILL